MAVFNSFTPIHVLQGVYKVKLVFLVFVAFQQFVHLLIVYLWSSSREPPVLLPHLASSLPLIPYDYLVNVIIPLK